MQQYKVTGMSCAACSARVEKAVSKVPGVTSCSVSLLTNAMGVEGTASPESIIKAVQDAGYGASLRGAEEKETTDEFEDKETPKIKKRLIASVVLLILLMYISMGHMMWNFPLPKWFDGNHVAMGLAELLLSGMILVINQKFFTSGFKAVFQRSPNMDTLVALGSAASFIFSVAALFLMTDAQKRGDMAGVMRYMDSFYFESAAMIVTLITVGKMLEARSKGKTTDALKSLLKLAPKTAVVEKDGKEVTVPIETVAVGDIFVVRAGENIPTDGVVIDGSAAVDESMLTGESVPADKEKDDTVSAGTVNRSGFIRCRAVRVGEDTSLSQIIKTVTDAAATKAPIAKIADRVSGVFVPVVIGLAAVTFVVWMLLGKEFSYALARSISVLVISCPCALGLATPVAIMVGSGVGAKSGILFKTAAALEETGRIRIVALDKTGTITEGHPRVTDILPHNISKDELLKIAYSLEIKSEHPLARAIVEKGNEESVKAIKTSDFAVLPGNGISAKIENSTVLGGSMRYMSEKMDVPKECLENAKSLAKEGKNPLLFAKNGTFLGMIAVADTIKKESRQAVKRLQDMGIRVVMLTGDNQDTANAIAKQAGISEVVANVLPSGKERAIQSLKKEGKVAMVGDGINDAPALTAADSGIAIGAGTDVAIDAADVVLMKSRLTDVPAAIHLSRATLRNIHENLFWAFFYNVIGIPIAAGVFAHAGLTLNPMIGAAAMSLSSVCVVSNALRLNFCKIYGKGSTDGEKNAQNELVLVVKGMMCAHCEASVSKAVLSVPGVLSARADHKSGKVFVVLKDGAVRDTEKMKEAVRQAGYLVTAVK